MSDWTKIIFKTPGEAEKFCTQCGLEVGSGEYTYEIYRVTSPVQVQGEKQRHYEVWAREGKDKRYFVPIEHFAVKSYDWLYLEIGVQPKGTRIRNWNQAATQEPDQEPEGKT